MNETSDVMVCYELPCPSQQARSFKRKPEHDFVVPVFLADEPGPKMSSYGRVNVEYFGFPFLMRFAHQEARSVDEIRERVTEGIVRWTEHSRDLWNWTEDEVPAGDASASAKQNGDEDEDGEEAIEEVKIELEPVTPEVETVTEITEDGKVRDVQERVIQQVPTPTEEGEDDIADSKAMLIEDLSVTAEPMLRDVSMGADDHSQEAQTQPLRPTTTRRLAAKNNAFTLRLVSDYKKTSVGFGNINRDQPKFTSWDDRQAEAADEDGFLLREGDAIIVEFEPTVREYFFGSHRRFEHARFDPSQWDTFEHPELLQLRKGSKGPKRGMDLQECLDEFVREERLGEDDLWYCPKCKKHQQASKKFDLWKAPDVLVVHLKRFSSSRAMRDKIDTFVDFPIEGLNLEPMIEERKVARALAAAGVDMEALGVHDDGEPLVYDLFAVDEHLGGLGGGHYRAYAKNHMNSKWYHFDDSFVTESSAENAVVRDISTMLSNWS
jgi:ubiquitin carboxyl-terminal hydrolase 4/11/15